MYKIDTIKIARRLVRVPTSRYHLVSRSDAYITGQRLATPEAKSVFWNSLVEARNGFPLSMNCDQLIFLLLSTHSSTPNRGWPFCGTTLRISQIPRPRHILSN